MTEYEKKQYNNQKTPPPPTTEYVKKSRVPVQGNKNKKGES